MSGCEADGGWIDQMKRRIATRVGSHRTETGSEAQLVDEAGRHGACGHYAAADLLIADQRSRCG
jgi:hypothetical protein